MSQFYTHVVDHFAVHWSLFFVSFVIDCLIFCIDRWSYYKRQKLKLPDSMLNVCTVVFLNQCLVSVPIFYLTPETPEGPFFERENLCKIPLLLLCHEVLFYYIHRLLHEIPWVYEYIHKIHHRWTAPMAISALYSHPVEHAVANIFPIIASAKLVDLNFSTLRIWHVVSLVNAMLSAHGGYRLGSMHDLHHSRHTCNYGTLGILDKLHGTYQDDRAGLVC